MKRLFNVRSVCLLLAMLFTWSVASAQTKATSIEPGVFVTGSWPFDMSTIETGTYTQSGGTTTLTLEQPADLVFRIKAKYSWGDSVDKVFKTDGGDVDASTDMATEGKSASYKLNEYNGGNLKLPAGNYEITAEFKENAWWLNITRVKPAVFAYGYFYKFNGGEFMPLNEIVKLPEVTNESQLFIAYGKYNEETPSVMAASEKYYVTETAVPVDGGELATTTSLSEAAIKFATTIGAYSFSFDPATGNLTFTKEEYVAFLKYVKAITGADFVQSAAQDAEAIYLALGDAFPATVSAQLSDNTEVTYGPETTGTLPAVGGTFTLVKDGNAKVTSDIYANYKFSYTIDGDKIIVKVIEKTKVSPTIVYDFSNNTGVSKKITVPAGGAILYIRSTDLKSDYNPDGQLGVYDIPASNKKTENGRDLYDLTEYGFENSSFSFNKNNAYSKGCYLLPEGTFLVTVTGTGDYTVTIAKTEADKIILRGYYQLNGGNVLPMVVNVDENNDSTYTVSLPEVIGSNNKAEDLTETELRLLVGYYNDTEKKDPETYSYIYPSNVGDKDGKYNRLLTEEAIAVGNSLSFTYDIAEQGSMSDEEFVTFTTIRFEAARAAYDVTISPATDKFIFSRKEYVAFPRRIYPNKPDGVQSAMAFTVIPNDVSTETPVRYMKGDSIDFTVLKSLGLGREYHYAPELKDYNGDGEINEKDYVELKKGAVITLTENGKAKVRVAESAKYKLAYSLDKDNNVVVTVADCEPVIDQLEVFLTDGNDHYRALQLKFDPVTGHFTGSMLNDGFYGFILRTDKNEYKHYRYYESSGGDSVPYRVFQFSQSSHTPFNDWKTPGRCYSSIFKGLVYWIDFDAEELENGDIKVKVTRLEDKTVPDNAIFDDYYMVVTKEDGTETELPMKCNGYYSIEHQTAAGEKYHFRGKTTSILDGKTYVVNQYPIQHNGPGYPNYDDSESSIFNCDARAFYLAFYQNPAWIHALPVGRDGRPFDNNGNPVKDGEYHKFSFHWFYFGIGRSAGNRSVLTQDLDISAHPDPVLDVYTSGGKYGKLIYNHYRSKNEYAVHLVKGEKVWVAELGDGDKISHYWVANNDNTTFVANEDNPESGIKLGIEQFNSDNGFTVYTLSKDTDVNADAFTAPANAFIAPEDGDYYVAVSVNRNDPSDKKIKFTKAYFPDNIYIIFKPAPESESSNKYVVVRLPKSEDKKEAGYYNTTSAELLEVDAVTGEYITISDPLRLDTTNGNLTLYNNDSFVISDKIDYKNGGLVWGQRHGGYISETAASEFVTGKDVRVYRSDMQLQESQDAEFTKINMVEEGITVKSDQFMTTTVTDEDGIEQTVYTDRHSYVFYFDLTSRTDPKYSWGEKMNYKGVDYYLTGEYAKTYDDAVTISGDKKGIPFVFHPQTGLYTLSLKRFSGPMQIYSYSGNSSDNFHALTGMTEIVNTGVPFPLYNHTTIDGQPFNPLESDKDTNGGNFVINDPNGAIGSIVSEDYSDRDVYIYENVSFTFDPYSHRLWVNTRANEPDNKDIDPGKAEENPMYMIFVRVRDDEDAIGDSYRTWRGWAQNDARYSNMFTDSETEADASKQKILSAKAFEILTANMTDIQAAEQARKRFENLDHETRLRVAEAKIEFFTRYFEICGYRQMIPLRDNNNHFMTGEWSPVESTTEKHHGNGWIDTRRTNVRDGLNTCDESLANTSGKETLARLSYPMYLADESLVGIYHPGGNPDKEYQSLFEEHNLIAYFFGEKKPVEGETLLEYMSKTVCYGCSEDRNKVLRLGRRFDYIDGEKNGEVADGTEESANGQIIARIDRRSVGGRRAVLFEVDDEQINAEKTPAAPNQLQTSLDFRDPDDRITISDNIGFFNFFVMKIMRDSRFFVEFDNSTADIWSKVYRYDDKLYIVFNDIQDALADATTNGEAKPADVYKKTNPRYILMETVKKADNLDRIELSETDPDVLEHNYVTKRIDPTEYMGKHQRNPFVEDAGNGFNRFYSNKTKNNELSYFTVARKTVSDKGDEFNLHELLTGTYNWLPLAYNENGNRDATCKIKWESTGETVKDSKGNGTWNKITAGSVLSEPLVINRTGYLNFFSKDFLEGEQQVEANPENSGQQSARSRSFTKAPQYRAGAEGSLNAPGETSETGFVSTDNAAVDVIDANINDMYVESTNSKDVNNMYVYRAHVVLKGGQMPVAHIDPDNDGSEQYGYHISYDGGVAPTDLLYLERAQSKAVTTGVEDVVVDTPDEDAPEFNAVVTVDGRRLTVTGASSISVYTVSGMALADGADSFDRTVDPGVYIITADGATCKVLVK